MLVELKDQHYPTDYLSMSKDTMKIIFISDNGQHHYKLSFGKWLYALLLAFFLLLASLFSYALFHYGALTHGDAKIIHRFDSYLKRLSTLEAQTQRLNILGARIAQQNNIDIDSFSLEKAPARGGMVDANAKNVVLGEKNLIESIKNAEKALAEKEKIFNFYKDINTI